MKICIKCKSDKEDYDFGKDKNKKNGLSPYCRECLRKRSFEQTRRDKEKRKDYFKAYREKNRQHLRDKAKEIYYENIEKYRKNRRKYYEKNKTIIAIKGKIKRSSPEARLKENLRQKIWRENNQDLYRKYVREWQKRNKEKINAHAKVHRAVKKGILKRSKTCQKCGTNKGIMEGHHKDYSKPLKVQWLCRLCHSKKIETIKVTISTS